MKRREVEYIPQYFIAKHVRQTSSRSVLRDLTRPKAAARKNRPNSSQSKPYKKQKIVSPLFTAEEGLQRPPVA